MALPGRAAHMTLRGMAARRPRTAESAEASRGSTTPPALARLFEPIDLASLAVFRIAFGLLLVWEVWRYFHNGWVGSVYIAPPFHFTYAAFDWVRPWPGDGMYVHFFLVGLCAAFIAAGLSYRTACLLAGAGWTYVLLLEKTEYLNHQYLICLLCVLMAFVPANRLWSLDARRNPDLRSDLVPTWALWLLRFQIAIPYVYGGFAKLNPDWLRGQPMELWMSRMDGVRKALPFFGEEWAGLLFSYGGLLLDLLLVPLLLWRRTRPFAFAAAVSFHLFNFWMFRIGVFPWLMIVATTLFLDPAWPRRAVRAASRRRPGLDRREARERRTAGPASCAGASHRLVLGLAAAWFAVQLLVPFRHLLYPGRVDWTEEGARFSWRMMLRDKASAITILAVDPVAGRIVPINPRLSPLNPRRGLTDRQVEKMSEFPEMMHQYARFLGEQYSRSGMPPTVIRVRCLTTLNGRRPQPLIDPEVNLAGQPRGPFTPQPWIVPLKEPLPDQPYLVPPSRWQWEKLRPGP